eukprot:TRINITY_DN30030_c0_g1_i1.p1 TRINITY_DN30030_c0_g1~~TRINITY_DN30030_c0_g1_i1.p1  ORF type:complete len:898 (+),score=248.25 TRINITY_DN30030_c0_g1_i1:24-2696(+)
MVLASCTSLLLRSSFLAVASPLVFLGSILSQVSLDLELASLTNLEFAVVQEAVALKAQQQAAQNVGVAALDQAEANELEADAAGLLGTAAATEAKATSQEEAASAGEAEAAAQAEEAGGSAEAEATAGEAEAGAAAAEEAGAAEAGTAATETGAAVEGVQGVSEVAEQVEGVAAAITDALGDAGAAAAAAGADAAATAGGAALEAGAAEGVVESAAAATAGVVGAPALGTAAALGATAAAVAAEGPLVVTSVEDQWAAGSEEIRAASEQNLAIEKEAEAGGLEASVPVLQGGSMIAQEAAATSALGAAGYLAAATGSQLLALACQAPVALVVFTQGFCGAVAGALGGLGSLGGAFGLVTLNSKPTVDSTGLAAAAAANAALAAALAAVLVGPWSATVLAAARIEEAADGLAGLPALAKKAFISHGDAKDATKASSISSKRTEHPRLTSGNRSRHLQVVSAVGTTATRAVPSSAASDRELGWEDVGAWASAAGANLKSGVESAGQGLAAAGHGLQTAEENIQKAVPGIVNATREAIPQLLNATKDLIAKGKTTADKAIKDSSNALRQKAVDVAKKIVVKKPNTRTTTIAPLKVPDPPETYAYQHFLNPALKAVRHSLERWVMPIVLDIAIFSLAFLLFELTAGFGRHTPAYRRGEMGLGALAQQLASDVWAGWVWGAFTLVAVWALGIILAKELRPFAEHMQELPLHPVVPGLLGAVCIVACGYYAHVLFRFGSAVKVEPAAPQEPDLPQSNESKPLLTVSGMPAASRDCSHEEQAPAQAQAVKQAEATQHGIVLEVLLWSFGTLLGALVTALEGPLFTVALGGSFKSLLMSSWILGIVPWQHLAPQVFGLAVPVPVIMGLVMACSVLLGGMLFLAKRAAAAPRSDGVVDR